MIRSILKMFGLMLIRDHVQMSNDALVKGRRIAHRMVMRDRERADQ